ncbi:uncharacterized protein VTP21DRAFT_142 [Calcarisporiella thermophila]|uniref:uncharacterized protein n=1 Tax=Calcarisporiella thermophila TaxID=911321 RepID=UPI00374224C7
MSVSKDPPPNPDPAATPSTKRAHSKPNRYTNTDRLKVVIRQLPPHLPEQVFLQSVAQWANEETTDWYSFFQGKFSKSKSKESIASRAYFHFKNIQQVIEFCRGYDGHVFVDSKGNTSRAVVEFAPYQKLPKTGKKPDPRQGTIDDDPDYLAFLESLKAEEETEGNKGTDGLTGTKLEDRIANQQAALDAAKVNPKSTPLLDFLREKKAQKMRQNMKKAAKFAAAGKAADGAKPSKWQRRRKAKEKAAKEAEKAKAAGSESMPAADSSTPAKSGASAGSSAKASKKAAPTNKASEAKSSAESKKTVLQPGAIQIVTKPSSSKAEVGGGGIINNAESGGSNKNTRHGEERSGAEPVTNSGSKPTSAQPIKDTKPEAQPPHKHIPAHRGGRGGGGRGGRGGPPPRGGRGGSGGPMRGGYRGGRGGGGPVRGGRGASPAGGHRGGAGGGPREGAQNR